MIGRSEQNLPVRGGHSSLWRGAPATIKARIKKRNAKRTCRGAVNGSGPRHNGRQRRQLAEHGSWHGAVQRLRRKAGHVEGLAARSGVQVKIACHRARHGVLWGGAVDEGPVRVQPVLQRAAGSTCEESNGIAKEGDRMGCNTSSSLAGNTAGVQELQHGPTTLGNETAMQRHQSS